MKILLNQCGLIVLVFIFLACENNLSEVKQLVKEGNIGVEVATDVEILYSDSAIVRVKIKGPTMKRYTENSKTREEFPDGIAVDFFDKSGSVTGWLTAKKGVRLAASAEMIVQDSVVWESTQQERLETEELIWDEKTGKVHTNKFVVIRRPEEIIYGYGFEANQDFSRSRIRAIEGRLKIEDFEDTPEN